MDITTLFAGPVGAILGLGGSLIQKWLGMKEKAADHKMRLEELEIMSRIDLQKADINLRNTIEEKQGESFKAAIDAQAALKPSAPWARDFLALFRPGLTLGLMVCSTVMAFYFSDSKPELLDFVIVSQFSLSAISAAYWFGVRNDEKMRVTAAFPSKK